METARTPPGCPWRLTEQGRAGRAEVVTLNVFLDSSALAKRYVQEDRSDRVEEILSSASGLGVSVVCISEVISALCRRRREGTLSDQQYERAKRALLQDVEDTTVINVTDRVVARAVEILERWPLRSSDSLHIASAAEWGAALLVSADGRQCEAAQAYGLQVEELPAG